MLKVSFFGPFYSGYNVIAIDDEYRYALIAGESLKYLWILSRDTSIPVGINILRLLRRLDIEQLTFYGLRITSRNNAGPVIKKYCYT